MNKPVLKLVLLDAGHGGIIDGCYVTPGKRSPKWSDGSQYFEGVGNRMIRHELVKMLKAEGVRFKLLNEGDKDMPLRERTRLENHYAIKYGPNSVLTISIHSNGFSDPDARGWEAWTSKGNTYSDVYAQTLYEKIREQFPEAKFRTDKSDGDLDKEKHLHMTDRTIGPCVLSENFFHTNEEECKNILMTKEGRRRIARAHLEMIKEYYKF